VITTNINNIPLEFETTKGVFSPNNIDRGTLAMLAQLQISPADKLLDLGCGYGTVGIYAAKVIGAENVVMSDIDRNALTLAQKNAARNGVPNITFHHSDGFRSIPETAFTHIFSNPPYHADFSVPKHFIEKGFNRLIIGGRLYMVTKRLDWYKNKITAIFGGVKVIREEDYFVFIAEKRSASYTKGKR